MTVKELATHLQKIIRETPEAAQFNVLAMMETITGWGFVEVSHIKFFVADSIIVLTDCEESPSDN